MWQACEICGNKILLMGRKDWPDVRILCAEHLKSEVLTDDARKVCDNELFLGHRIIQNPAFKYHLKLSDEDYNRLCLQPFPNTDLGGWAKIAYDFDFWPLELLESLQIFLTLELAQRLDKEYSRLEQNGGIAHSG